VGNDVNKETKMVASGMFKQLGIIIWEYNRRLHGYIH